MVAEKLELVNPGRVNARLIGGDVATKRTSLLMV